MKKKIEEMIVWHDGAVLVSKQLLFDLIDQTNMRKEIQRFRLEYAAGAIAEANQLREQLSALKKQVEEMSEPTSEMIHMANLFLGDGFEQNWGDGYCWNESAIILRKTTEPSLTEYVVITRSHRIVKFFGHYSANAAKSVGDLRKVS